MIRATLLVCFIHAGCIMAQQTARPLTGEEKISWSADSVYRQNPYDTSSGYFDFYLRKITYTLGDKIMWTVGVPDGMKHRKASCIFVIADKADSANSTDKFTTLPVNINQQKDFLRCPETILADAIVVSHSSGLLILDKNSGRVIADLPYGETSEYFYVDTGRFEIVNKRKNCSGNLNHGAIFISRCNNYLFHFEGSELFVFNKEYQLIGKMTYRASDHLTRSGATKLQAIIRWKKYKIQLDGMVFLN